jgi:hypothetical protein
LIRQHKHSIDIKKLEGIVIDGIGEVVASKKAHLEKVDAEIKDLQKCV